jgi:hypothetical protein
MTTSANRMRWRLLRNSSRVYLERVNQDFATTMKPGSRILEASVGDAPYTSSHMFSTKAPILRK